MNFRGHWSEKSKSWVKLSATGNRKLVSRKCIGSVMLETFMKLGHTSGTNGMTLLCGCLFIITLFILAVHNYDGGEPLVPDQTPVFSSLELPSTWSHGLYTLHQSGAKFCLTVMGASRSLATWGSHSSTDKFSESCWVAAPSVTSMWLTLIHGHVAVAVKIYMCIIFANISSKQSYTHFLHYSFMN